MRSESSQSCGHKNTCVVLEAGSNYSGWKFSIKIVFQWKVQILKNRNLLWQNFNFSKNVQFSIGKIKMKYFILVSSTQIQIYHFLNWPQILYFKSVQQSIKLNFPIGALPYGNYSSGPHFLQWAPGGLHYQKGKTMHLKNLQLLALLCNPLIQVKVPSKSTGV